MKRPKLMQYPGTTLLLLALSSVARMEAQNAPSPQATQSPQQPIVELSPFVVQGEADRGYQATTTLSGTRLRTNIADVGASISVYTSDFLDDTGSKDLEDLLVYATGAEVPGVGGNISNPAPVFGRTIGTRESVVRAQNNTRIRGLAAADLTRDYFLTDIPFDAYNTERVTINRGSNSFLFGLGSPAGIIENSLKRANFSNHGEVSLAVDSFEGNRATLDVNREIIDNKLAVRVAALREDKRFNIDPTFEKDTRVYATTTFKPWSATNLKVSYERGKVRSNLPRLSPPVDNITKWWDSSHPLFPTQLDQYGKPYFDPRKDTVPSMPFYGPGAPLFTPAIILDQPGQVRSGSLAGTEAVIIGRVTRPGLPLDIRFTGLGNSTGDVTITRPAFSTFYVNRQLSDPSVFDFNRYLLDGPNKREWKNFDALTIELDQLFLDDRAGVQLAYDHQNYDDGSLWMFNQSRGGEFLTIDPNIVFPDGRPNPNYGRPYISGDPIADERFVERDAFRAQAFYRWDFTNRRDSWLRHVGRHVLTGSYQQQQIDRKSADYRGWAWGAERANYARNAQARDITSDPWRAVGVIRYLGPSLAAVPQARGIQVPNIKDPIHVRPIETVSVFNDFAQQWETVSLPTVGYENDPLAVATGGSLSQDRFRSYSSVLQSWWFSDLVVSTLGVRRDEASNLENANPQRDPVDRHALIGDKEFVLPRGPRREVTQDIFSWSVVAHAPRSWVKRLPWLSGVSVHYSESENFQPAAGRVDVFGRDIDSPKGLTDEKGFTVSALDNRLSLRVNWYETSQQNVSEPTLPSSALMLTRELETLSDMNAIIANEQTIRQSPAFANAQPFANLRNFQDLQTGGPLGFPKAALDALNFRSTDTDGDGRQDQFTFAAPGGMVSTSDVVSKGVEIELVANPTKNWTLLANIAQQEASRANSGTALRELIASRLPVYEQFGDLPQASHAGFSIESRLFGDVVNPARKVFLQDGKAVSDEIRKWRVNLVTNYRFSPESPFGSRLAGFGLGGAWRWQDRVAVGYPGRVDPELGEVLDVDNPLYGDAEQHVDLWVSYERRIWRGIEWKLQLNVRNALNNDDLAAAYTNPDGSIAAWRIQQGRKFTLSSTFTF